MGAMWVFLTFWNNLVSVLTVAVQFLIDVFGNFWTFISEQFAAGQRFFQGLLDFITGVFTGNWEQAWSGLGDMVGGVFDGIVSSAKFALRSVRSVVNTLIGAYNTANDIAGLPDISPIPAFASGVRNFSGGLAVVGERGPELVNLPRGSDVYSNQESRQMAGGQPVTINIDARGALLDDKTVAGFFRRTKKIAREQGFATT
jgi:phage-related protein